MARIIEAKAIISAEDRTGRVLDGIAKKFREAGKATKVSAEIDRLNQSLGNTRRQLEAVGKVHVAHERLNSAKLGLSGANAKAEAVATKLAAARKAENAAATAALVAEQRQADRAVLTATRSVGRQGDALREAKQELAGFGVPITNLVAHEAALKASIDKTTAAINHETAALKKREDAAEADARAKADQGQPVPIAHPRDRKRAERRRRADAGTAGSLRGDAGLILGGFGAADAYKRAAAFDRRLTMIGQTADATRPEIDALGASVHDLAQATATPVDKLAGGLEALVAQGRNLKESIEFLPSVASTAAATGAEVDDIAKTADSVGSNFKIAGRDMQSAFDIMAAGGKAGQFELKDMARYLPSLGPATAAIGFQGKNGLADLVAMLQVMRKGSGTAEEAVSSMTNVINKMESDKTAKGFKALGIDSAKAFAKARKEGRNLVEVFEELLQQATKGDKSKIGEIIDDQEFKRGALALMSFSGEWQKLSKSLQATSSGTVAKDIARVTADSQASLDRFNNTYQRVTQAAALGFDMIGGNRRLQGMSGEIEAIAAALERVYAAYDKGGLRSVGEAAATIASEARDKAQAKLDAIRLANADDSVRARENAIHQKEKELAQAEETVRGGGVRGMLEKGHVFTLQRELEHLRKGLPKIERQRDITKAGPRPLRFGTDPNAPMQGKPVPIMPGPKAWLEAYPLEFGTRLVPLPPQRPGALPTDGAPRGVNTIDEALNPSGAPGRTGWSDKFDGKTIPGEMPAPREWSPAFGGKPIPVEVTTLPEQAVSPVGPHPLPPTRPLEFGNKPIPVEVLSLPEQQRAEKAAPELDTIDRRSVPDQRLEATVRPDQITAKVEQLPPISGEASVNVQSQVNVAVTLNEPMLNAKVEAAAGRAAAKMSLSSSGARPGAVSMPGAAATPGAQ